jgi:hypothetical protein
MLHFSAAARWWTQVQATLEVPPSAEPEPDLLIATQEPPPGNHLQTGLLVVEVALTS